MRLPILGALIFHCFVGLADEAVSDREVWNEGVDSYRAGDVTNALRKLRPLMVSKEYAARAAEVVAKLEFDRDNREEAAYAAQIALRANPKEERAIRNFARATDGLLGYREEKRIAALMEGAKGKDSSARLRQARDTARELLEAAETYLTNAPATAVQLADRYEERAKKLADEWIVLNAAIGESVTNAQQAVAVSAQIEQARETTLNAAREFSDLEETCYSSMSSVEQDFTRFYKSIALPPAAIDEDLVSQSNVLNKTAAINTREWQPEALDYTRVFRAKFPEWARQYEAQAAVNTNMPPFTAETQGRIAALATELEKVQLTCMDGYSSEQCVRALGLLVEIKELLPKDGSQNPQSNPQSKEKTDDRKKESGEDDTQKENKSEEPRQVQGPTEDESPQGEKEAQEERQTIDSADEDILKKALERNEEHEAAKKARMRKMRRPPNERDW